MQLEIHHHTSYKYSDEVFAEPHHLYFYPLQRNYFRLLDFAITLHPEPSGLSLRVDAENNSYYQCWFNHKIPHLTIDVSMQLATFDINPFDFLQEENPKIDHHKALELYLEPVSIRTEIDQWIREIKKPSGSNLITFLTFLNKEIHADWRHNEHYSNDVLTPDVCFSQKEGSCRDLAWMLIQMLRNLGIAARFVSGYAFNPEQKEAHQLHAWVEAWIPGGGWIGLDPSAGLLATDHYFPVATSYKPENTRPVQGNYRGDAAYELTFEVTIKDITS